MAEQENTNKPLDNGYIGKNPILVYYKNNHISLNKSEKSRLIHFDSLSHLLAFGKAAAVNDKKSMKAIYQAHKKSNQEYQNMADKVEDKNNTWPKEIVNWVTIGTQAKLMQDVEAQNVLKKQKSALIADLTGKTPVKDASKENTQSLDASQNKETEQQEIPPEPPVPDDENYAAPSDLPPEDAGFMINGMDSLDGLVPPPEDEQQPVYGDPEDPNLGRPKETNTPEKQNFEQGTEENKQEIEKEKEKQDESNANPENMSTEEINNLFTDKDTTSPENKASSVINTKGDLTQLDPNKPGVIIQQVNCMNKMGAGLAAQLMRKWPKISDEYHKYCEGKNPNDLLGHMQSVKLGPNFFVINSFTQKGYGRQGHYTYEDLLIKNIRKTAQSAQKHNWSVFIPDHIGAGLGGGDWSKIYNGIKDLNNVVIVRKPKQRQYSTNYNHDYNKRDYNSYSNNYHKDYNQGNYNRNGYDRGYGNGYSHRGYENSYDNGYNHRGYNRNNYNSNYNRGYNRNSYSRNDYSDNRYSGNGYNQNYDSNYYNQDNYGNRREDYRKNNQNRPPEPPQHNSDPTDDLFDF